MHTAIDSTIRQEHLEWLLLWFFYERFCFYKRCGNRIGTLTLRKWLLHCYSGLWIVSWPSCMFTRKFLRQILI